MQQSDIIAHMLRTDRFSQWLGIRILEQAEERLRISMQIRPEMCNAFKVAHGGILYSFADTALAFASNSSGRHALSIESSISHLKAVYSGTIISAIATRLKEGHNIAVYHVAVHSENNELIADFKGTVFRKTEQWMNDTNNST